MLQATSWAEQTLNDGQSEDEDEIDFYEGDNIEEQEAGITAMERHLQGDDWGPEDTNYFKSDDYNIVMTA